MDRFWFYIKQTKYISKRGSHILFKIGGLRHNDTPPIVLNDFETKSKFRL